MVYSLAGQHVAIRALYAQHSSGYTCTKSYLAIAMAPVCIINVCAWHAFNASFVVLCGLIVLQC